MKLINIQKRRRKMRKSCVYFLKMVQSIQLPMEKPSSVVLVVCSPASFFLSYTSTRIPTVRIFPTSRDWGKLGWHKQSRPRGEIAYQFWWFPWHETCFTGDGGGRRGYSPSHRVAGQVISFLGGLLGTAGETVFGREAEGNFWKDRTGPLNAVHRRPAPGRTDCPVVNTLRNPAGIGHVALWFPAAWHLAMVCFHTLCLPA